MELLLLDAAEQLLEDEGPDALSVRRIAAAAGVAPMGVYNHFASKSGIIDGLFIRGFDRLRDALVTLVQIDDPFDAMLEGGRRYRNLALAHPRTYALMFLRPVAGYRPSAEAKQVAAGAFGGLVMGVERAMQSGVIDKGDPAEVAQMIWASCHGWVSLEICDIGFVSDLDGGADRLRHALLRGLRSAS